MELKEYFAPMLEQYNAVVERGFEVSNLENIYGEYPEQEW